MSLVVGISMIINGALQWFLFYAPSHELPEPAASSVRRLFAAYFVLAVCCTSVVKITGIGAFYPVCMCVCMYVCMCVCVCVCVCDSFINLPFASGI